VSGARNAWVRDPDPARPACHIVTVAIRRAVAECICGWHGPLRPSRARAWVDADRHRNNPETKP
jgi:hypothetical protein